MIQIGVNVQESLDRQFRFQVPEQRSRQCEVLLHFSEYATIRPLGWLFTDSKKKQGEPSGSPCCLIDQIVFAADFARTLLLGADGGLQGAAAGDDAHGGYWFLRAGVCELRLFLRSVHAKR